MNTVEVVYTVLEFRTAQVSLEDALADDLADRLAGYEEAGKSALHGLERDVDTSALPEPGEPVTVRVSIGQEQYLERYAMSLSGSGGDDHLDLLHDEAFGFGRPDDARAEIVGVDGPDFIVEYTTDAPYVEEEA